VLQLFRERDHKRRRFARAGLRERDDVAALQGGRDHCGLNRRGMLESHIANRLQDRRAEAESVEGLDGGGHRVMWNAIRLHPRTITPD